MKNSITGSFFWKISEKFGSQIIQFVLSMIIARLLSPKEYGVIAVLMIFISIAQLFVQSGLGMALVQKKEIDNIDYSSVFYFSLFVALFMYVILFFASPFLSDFFAIPLLKNVIRIASIILFFAAINTVQFAFVLRNMLFKQQFFCTSSSALFSGFIGVIFAYLGYGVWALVLQQMVFYCTNTVLLFYNVSWRPTLQFSFIRIQKMLSYGVKLLMSNLLDKSYHNIIGLVISKKFSSFILALFEKGKQFPLILIDNIDGSFQSVMMPVYSKNQNDLTILKSYLRKSISLSSYISFISMALLAIISQPMIQIILGDKWMGCVIFLQIYCFIAAFFPFQTSNMQAINALGYSGLNLKIVGIKRMVGVICILIATYFNNIYLILGITFSMEILSILLMIKPNEKYLNYSFRELINDVIPNFILVVPAIIVSCLVLYVEVNAFYMIILQSFIFGACIILLSYVFNNNNFFYLKERIIKKINHR